MPKLRAFNTRLLAGPFHGRFQYIHKWPPQKPQPPKVAQEWQRCNGQTSPPWALFLFTPIAGAAHLHLHLTTPKSAWGTFDRMDRHSSFGQTGHVAARGAHEMGMKLLGGMLDFRGELETPKMIAEVGPPHEPSFCQIRQVSVDGRAIEPSVFETITHLGV